MLTCEWFALCTNTADGYADHPVLTVVPICEPCAERAGVPIAHRFGTGTCPDCGCDVYLNGVGLWWHMNGGGYDHTPMTTAYMQRAGAR